MLTVAVVGPLYFLFLRCRGYRLRDLDATRRHWAELRRRHPGPWLICGNHLTLIDSMLLTYGLMSLSSHFKEFRALPWNLPERANFQKQLWKGLLCYLAKCIPVSRGGDREEMQTTLGKCNWVLQNNRVLMIFPEGGAFPCGQDRSGEFLLRHRTLSPGPPVMPGALCLSPGRSSGCLQ